MTAAEPLAASTAAVTALLEVDDLTVTFRTEDGIVPAVESVSFALHAGEVLGLVGESGSGKSVTSLAVMRLLSPRTARVRGRIHFGERDLTALSRAEMRQVRGGEIAMVFQEPMTSLNPAFTVGDQIAEATRLHLRLGRRESWRRAVEMLERVGIPDPHRRVKDYPHAFSGGMRQRVMLAMALSCAPRLLIADEPTTALDVTVQAQILELLRGLQRDLGLSVLFVTHDLGVVADVCDRVVVMYAGQVVEAATVDALFAQPSHPYTEALLASMPQATPPHERLRVIPGQVPRADEMPVGCRFAPRCEHVRPECSGASVELREVSRRVDVSVSRCVRQPGLALVGASAESEPVVDARAAAEPDVTDAPASVLLRVEGLAMAFPVHSAVLRRVTGHVRAVDGVDFEIAAGDTLGLVGESGSGKSTTARLVLRLIEPTAGTVALDGREITGLGANDLRVARREMQMVFQDPFSSLNPRHTVGEIIGEPLEVHERVDRTERDRRVAELLEEVGLGAHLRRRYPHEFSGGQRQRVAIARALALSPKLVVCDEPISSLDVSTQSQVINLLTDLQARLGLTYLFIAHDLSVVRHLSDRIAVMYLGRIVEAGDAETVYTRPRHPYTEALLSAIPVPDPVRQRTRQRIVLEGDIPSPLEPPEGCRFHTRCPYAMDLCRIADPPAFTTSDGTTVHCHLHTEGPVLDGAPITHLRSGGG